MPPKKKHAHQKAKKSEERMQGEDLESSIVSECSSSNSFPEEEGSRSCDKNSTEYRLRRERNNLAVKKSRTRSKQKAQQTLKRVTQLREENYNLETKISTLNKELGFLKDIFCTQSGVANSKALMKLNTSPTLTANSNNNNCGELPTCTKNMFEVAENELLSNSDL